MGGWLEESSSGTASEGSAAAKEDERSRLLAEASGHALHLACMHFVLRSALMLGCGDNGETQGFDAEQGACIWESPAISQGAAKVRRSPSPSPRTLLRMPTLDRWPEDVSPAAETPQAQLQLAASPQHKQLSSQQAALPSKPGGLEPALAQAQVEQSPKVEETHTEAPKMEQDSKEASEKQGQHRNLET